MIDLSNLKDLHLLALKEKDESTIIDCNERIRQISDDVKKNEINCFLSDENDGDIYLKFTLEQEALKVKIGQICSEGCI